MPVAGPTVANQVLVLLCYTPRETWKCEITMLRVNERTAGHLYGCASNTFQAS